MSPKKVIGDPLEQAALTGKIGSRTSSSPTIESTNGSAIQNAGSLAVQHIERPIDQKSSSPELETGRSSKVQAAKGERVQQTVYLPPGLAKWLKIQAIEEDREISEIAADALTWYRQNH